MYTARFFLSIIISAMLTLPWLMATIVMVMVLMRRKRTGPLIMQAMGAAGMLVLTALQVGLSLAQYFGLDVDVVYYGRTIVGLLTFLALGLFVAGFSIEKLQRTKEMGFPVELSPPEK